MGIKWTTALTFIELLTDIHIPPTRHYAIMLKYMYYFTSSFLPCMYLVMLLSLWNRSLILLP